MPGRVDLGAKLREDAREVLHLVQHNQLLPVTREVDGSLCQRRTIARALQVEHDGIRLLRGDGARQRGLADLARSDQHDGGELRQPGDVLGVGRGRETVLRVEGGDGEGEKAGPDPVLELLRGHCGLLGAGTRGTSRARSR